MNVLLLSHGFQAEYELGVANGLAANGVQVTLVACDGTLFARLDPRILAPNVRGSQDPSRSRLDKVRNVLVYMVRYLLLVARRRHDVVHNIGLFATGNAWVSLAEAAIARVLSKRYVLTVHNVLPHERHTTLNRWVHRRLYALPQRLVVHTLRARRRLIAEFGVSPANVLVMEHGIDRFPDFDDLGRRQIRSRLKLAEGARLVLFFGQLGWYKGPDLLLDALARLPPEDGWNLLIAGRCTHANVRSSIGAQIAASPARDSIHWWERYIDGDEVPALFHAADVLALPYRHIDQSGVLFMAMATGLPVLATDVGSFRHYVDQHAGVIVPPENVDALAEGLRRAGIPFTPTQRRALAASAHRFDWRRTVRALLPGYDASYQSGSPAAGASIDEVKGS